ncbi:Cu,Zn superoxide dismutase-like protein [Cucurbitaria berberidis CBS 394.84]|uniref:superoxide dismutase n=1 Tax=Cucurbitaria berberidis CBS 394.84 TaxID=1168544 RepID=A0A9P4G892_9PLEO|nr:Cu,Zn superoxide dismutase-like protein [Cucurbitaria berberidis CBS 394.84]KAF1840856.1 Cu,Zn superoxide dismutase-like protein [Cucurbitaria berberidis CBS 394.84]
MLVQIVSLLAAASIASAQSSVTPAPAVASNPAGASYVGVLPEKAGSNLRGSISAVSAADGKGVKFSVSFSGLPAEGGPFMYHIHEKPVPANGNCTGTGAHLDPYKRGEVPICDASKPETCQTGDLSGKYGNITAGEWSQEYVDPYSATRADDPAFFGNLSFVVHLSNKTRIGCANFTVGDGYKPAPSSSGAPKPSHNASTPAPTGSAPVPSASSSTPAEFPGAAAKVVAGPAALFALVAALVL